MEQIITEVPQAEPAKNNKQKESPEAKKAFEWLMPIIESCTNTFHIKCAGILVNQFKEIYSEKYAAKTSYDLLRDKIMEKIATIDII